MTTKEAIKTALASTQNLLQWYVGDLSDADFLERPAPRANHIAWQVGHLISSEIQLLGEIAGANYPELPAGFAEQHSKTTANMDPAKGFVSKATYLELFNKIRSATLAMVDQMSDADFDRQTTGSMAQFAPTHGHLLLLQANHTMMHVGQFTVVRRKLAKPVLF